MLLGLPVEFIGLFLLMAGYIIGLGAVTVIDLHGLCGRTSGYWTQATIRTHKITKPLIWIGTALAVAGGIIFYSTQPASWMQTLHLVAAIILVLNGLFLSFVVSPFLLAQERAGKDQELLPAALQRKIIISFCVSVLGWWGSLVAFIYYITTSFIV